LFYNEAKAQNIGAAYYKRKLSEKQAPEKSKWIDIYVDSPVYVGIVNQVKISGIDIDEFSIADVRPFIKTAIKGEFQITGFTPGTVILYLKNKSESKNEYVGYAYHYRVKRLHKDELKEEPELTIGNISGTKISISQLLAQKEIKLTKGFKLITGQLYFSGNGFPNVLTISVLGIPDKVDSLLKSCKPGSQIVFDNFKVADSSGREFYIAGKVYTVLTDEEASTLESHSFAELVRLINLNFVSGSVYFSGTYFPNVVRISGSEINTAKKYLFARSAPGSTISFENCIYKNEKGVLESLPDISITE
jgi:hypothetical protein